MNKHSLNLVLMLALPVCASLPLAAHGQLVINDTLTGAESSFDWMSLRGACLTAGTGTAPTAKIPGCAGLAEYNGKVQVGGTSGRLPDAVGQGALRLTNGDFTTGSNGDGQTGAVVSNFVFPSKQGLQVTFTTVTYGGDDYSGTGADGITFYLADGAQPPSVGALGGSLGYSCSNVNSVYDGVLGGYLGVGIDEFGNFSNSSDNTASGPGRIPGSISVRGAGNVNWTWLNANYPQLYPSNTNNTDRRNAVQATCKTGLLFNASGSKQSVTVKGVSENIKDGASSKNLTVPNYPFLETSKLPSTVSISNQGATAMPKRGDAKPITYGLSISADGFLNLSYSFNGGSSVSVIKNRLITDSNGPLPDKFRFGFSAGTGGGSNVHEITCFKAAELIASSTSSAANVQQSSRVETGAHVYFANYHPTNWWGELTAVPLSYNSATDSLELATVAKWNANCVLTGGICESTTPKPATTSPLSTTAQGSSSRSLLTWNGSTGIAFNTANMILTLPTTSVINPARLAYLRGDRTLEITSSNLGTFRERTGVLGDIINSSPTWVGAPSLPYNGPWVDAIKTTVAQPEGTSYAAFAAKNVSRAHVVYVGANDGFLHGFRAGANKADGKFDTSAPNDGKELMGYMPSAVLATIENPTRPTLEFSSARYAHTAFVDATPGTGDLFYQNAWHTWLVGGLGAGGNATGTIGDTSSTGNGAIYALDITNPNNFSEASAASVVIGDWTSKTLSCLNNTPVNCGDNLGSTYGTPIIRRLHDGNWAVIFGNGFNSSTGTAGIFIMKVDQANGSRSFRFLDTGRRGTSGTVKNGIAYVASADLDNDHITDYVYAGDVQGNVWRFDLTSSAPGNWKADSSPLFSTPTGQPITTSVTVSSTLQKTGNPRVLIGIATGQILQQTQTSAATYAPAIQSLYGIWDWNMDNWNSKNSAQYASLAAPQTLNVNFLQSQSAANIAGSTASVSGYRTVTTNAVCWKGLSVCASGNNQFGWQLALPSGNEQVIYNPTTRYGLFIVNTTIPAVNAVLSCDVKPPSGYTMAINIDTGGSPAKSFFGTATNNYASANGLIISGIGLSATGTPSFFASSKKTYMINQTADGLSLGSKSSNIVEVNPILNGLGKRVNWIKLR